MGLTTREAAGPLRLSPSSGMGDRVATAVCFFLLVPGGLSATFTFSNNCGYTVWPGLLSGAGSPPLSTTGFALGKGESRSVQAPGGWSGRFWGRTLCGTDAATGKFTCATADCGSTTVECSGTGAAPPATLAEFTLDGGGGMDFYDVSLVDGYNLPMLVVPQGAAAVGGNGSSCGATGCVADLNGACPSELRVRAGGGEGAVACRSACGAFGRPEYCCSGAYGSPSTCKPTSYSQIFKTACPRAYSYAYDDGTSTFTCPGGGGGGGGTGYLITFCPATTTQKSAAGMEPRAVPIGSGAGAGGFTYGGWMLSSSAAGSPRPRALLRPVVSSAAVGALLRLLL